jgi:hypothetical protein
MLPATSSSCNRKQFLHFAQLTHDHMAYISQMGIAIRRAMRAMDHWASHLHRGPWTWKQAGRRKCMILALWWHPFSS